MYTVARTWLVATLASLFVPGVAAAVQLTVVTPVADPTSVTGTRLVPLTDVGFRYLIEEDNTDLVIPGPAGAANANIPSLTRRKSHTPVVRAGVDDATASASTTDLPTGTATVDGLDPAGRYVVSVLPLNGPVARFTLGGASFAGSAANVQVVVHRQPVPTAQISILAFHDNRPINAAPDVPAEGGLQGFSVQLFDAGGQISQDAFGNMLGTTYQKNNDGTPKLDAAGNPIVHKMGSGEILTDANGEALIQYLFPGKYGVKVVPPIGTSWIQTSTIEGTHVVDAWVKAGEPPYFAEWGFFMWHAFFGFVQPITFPETPTDPVTGLPNGTTATINGRVVYVHDSHPPDPPGLAPGRPVPDCWVGLSDLNNLDEQVYAGPCTTSQGDFVIPDVPPGNYMLTLWDYPLDAIIDFRFITVAAGETLALGDVPIFGWFGNLEGNVFFDYDGDGERGMAEAGLPGAAVNLRFPDGSLYQATAADPQGEYAFREVFPWFFPIVAEVDFAAYAATSMRAVVDNGGAMLPGAVNTPQLQPENSMLPWRTEYGEVLTQMITTYAGQTNVIDWGKGVYDDRDPTSHGGISGVVYYAVTRAEDDPRYAAPEPWEPGVPRVQVNLYRDGDLDGVADDVNGIEGIQYADVDNHPQGNFPGAEDVNRIADDPANPEDVAFDSGDAVQITYTDSWDDNLPTGCVEYWRDPLSGSETWWSNLPTPLMPQIYGNGLVAQDCADTLRTWNQIRPGLFDGGYAFKTFFAAGVPADAVEDDPRAAPITSGYWVVEAVPPYGYEIQAEEDKNVESGDAVVPALLPPLCVGDLHVVDAFQSLFPDDQLPAPYAGQSRPWCDRKHVRVAPTLNAAADFFVFTQVPKAARIWGMALNDVALTFDPASPMKGSNLGAPNLPISIRDWSGQEIGRTYTDQWGKYNALVPSTYTVNVASPSGVAPNILTVCVNSPGAGVPGTSGFILDPHYNPQYSQVCTNWDFWPGKTTRLDTPILPIGGFSANPSPVKCDAPSGTPHLLSVTTSSQPAGPHLTETGGTLIITSVGTVDPDPTVTGDELDYSFGPAPAVLAGATHVTLDGVPLAITSWNANVILATVPAYVSGERGPKIRQLLVRRTNGVTTPVGITVYQGTARELPVRVVTTSIQQAIDAAPAGSLVLVPPGTYREAVILWKKLYLQGAGAFSTRIMAGPRSPAEILAWENQILQLELSNDITLIPGERADFFLENGAGITVVARQGGAARDTRIDGFWITDAIKGGGIFVNAFTSTVPNSAGQGDLSITNNRLESNQGSFGGGIRVGTPSLVNGANTGYLSSQNTDLTIRYNQIFSNGATDGGGGVALFNGADRYRLVDNAICANFSLLYGGGVAHHGLSPGGTIARNLILSNEAFDEAGGIMVAGELVPALAPAGTLTQGSGAVLIDSNRIQGNKAGDDGGGIRLLQPSGQDVAANPSRLANRPPWYRVRIFNNLVVNNSSADTGGGIALFDAADVQIVHNTVAHNDSTATGVDAFGGPCPPTVCIGEGFGGLTTSVPQVAGIASRAHSDGLRTAMLGAQTYADPLLENNIVWENRSFYWDANAIAVLPGGETVLGALVAHPQVYWDLGVYPLDAAMQLHPLSCLLTDATGLPGNLDGAPAFVAPYFNQNLATSKGAAFGNFVVVTFLPTGLAGDYHLQAGSAAIGGAGPTVADARLAVDFDQQPRPGATAPADIGADEVTP